MRIHHFHRACHVMGCVVCGVLWWHVASYHVCQVHAMHVMSCCVCAMRMRSMLHVVCCSLVLYCSCLRVSASCRCCVCCCCCCCVCVLCVLCVAVWMWCACQHEACVRRETNTGMEGDTENEASMACHCNITAHHVTSHHITSHHITSHHVT